MKSISMGALLTSLIFQHVHAQDLADPRTRDEEVSGTMVDVAVERLPSGFYNYVYSLATPSSNKGIVTSLDVDISCETAFDNVVFPEPPTPLQWDYSRQDGKHAPVQIYPSPTGSAFMMLTGDNGISFLINMQPDESHTGFRILSPYPPIDREYELSAHWGFDGYDYDSISDEEMQTVPWKHDFTVKGMTKGPGCSAEPQPPALFAGNPVEPYNNLLQYASPKQSAFHSEDDTVTFDVHCSEALEPESFKVEPGWARKHFTPVPGMHDVVTLKLHPGVNQFRFEGWKQQGVELEPMRENRNQYPDKDNDTFTIRRDPPGHDREKPKGGDAK
ncbi:MAG TPA: hypothetical protein VF267_12190 [Gammaproteobacteria bacterium]